MSEPHLPAPRGALEDPPAAHVPPAAEARGLLQLAIPIVVSLAASTLIGVVDTIMVAPLGTDALAAVSLTASVHVVVYAALYGLVSMAGVLAARAHGGDEPAALTRALWAGLALGGLGGTLGAGLMIVARGALPALGQPQAVLDILGPYWTAMSLVLLPFALFYALKGVYEAVDRPWVGVHLAFVGVALNVPANALLIHGIGEWPGLGLLGAGLASLLSQTAGLGLLVLHWRRARSMAWLRTGVRARWADLAEQARDGLPLAFGYAGEGAAFAAAGLMVGWFGAEALAANQIVGAVSGVLYMVPLGMAAAVSVRVGQAVGARRPDRARTVGLVAIGLVVAWMGAVTFLLVLLGGTIAEALAQEAAVAELATVMFIVFAGMQVFDGVQATALGALRGLLDTRWPVVVTLTAYWIVALPAAYVLSGPLDIGPNGVWIGYGTGLVIAALTLCVRFVRRPFGPIAS
ncbi:MAG: MATE family efflux transporter [Bacteroidota bacterium]